MTDEHPSLIDLPKRSLSLKDIGFAHLLDQPRNKEAEDNPFGLGDDNPILKEVRLAQSLGYGGVILSGPPGTGKSWYAARLAETIGQDQIRPPIQFHPSYQYEDFMFGFTPNENGHFVVEAKEFPQACEEASATDETYVLVIDEISRTDVIRVFGEALTYLEMDKRGKAFQVASGEEMIVPPNLFVIATTNPWDRGVDQMDMALERRFATIRIDPDPAVLREMVATDDNGDFVDRLVAFFEQLQKNAVQEVHLGHAYFQQCTSPEHAAAVWRMRILPTLERALERDQTELLRLKTEWQAVVKEPSETQAPSA